MWFICFLIHIGTATSICCSKIATTPLMFFQLLIRDKREIAIASGGKLWHLPHLCSPFIFLCHFRSNDWSISLESLFDLFASLRSVSSPLYSTSSTHKVVSSVPACLPHLWSPFIFLCHFSSHDWSVGLESLFGSFGSLHSVSSPLNSTSSTHNVMSSVPACLPHLCCTF